MAESLSIKSMPRDPHRCTLRVGRATVATLSRETVATLGLRSGMDWTDALAQQVLAAARKDAAERDALRIIRRRAISSGDLTQKLCRKGHERQTVTLLVADWVARGVLNDEQYGRTLVAVERARKPAGRRLLQMKLYQKGVDKSLIQNVLNQTEQQVDPVADARQLVERKMKSATLIKCDKVTRQRRLVGLLSRRGFDGHVIRTVLGEIDNC